jgi:hypothetical protein
MAHIVQSFVGDQSTTTGTGNLSLGGARTGFRALSAVCANSDTFFYSIRNPGTTEFEVGLGLFNSTGPVLQRTTVFTSSNSNNAVSFTAGTKTIDIVEPAEQILAEGFAGADNTGGATITMGTGDSFNLITSTTAITAFAFTNNWAGRKAIIRFNTVRTLTHNATSLIIPGAANITTGQGDIALIENLGSINFRVNFYQRANGTGIIAGSTSIVVNTGTFERAALTGAVTAAQNSNATVFDTNASGAGLTGGGSAILAVGAGTHITVNADDVAVNLTTLVPAIDSPSVVADGTVLERAALTGAIAAAQDSNTTVFAGIQNAGSATTDRTNLNFIGFTVADNPGSDRIDITNTAALAAPGVQVLTGAGPHNNVVLLDTTTVLRCDSTCTVTGIVSSTDGRPIDIVTDGNDTLTLLHGSGSSSAANQLACPNGADYVQLRGGARVICEEGSAWRVSGTAQPTANGRVLITGTVNAAALLADTSGLETSGNTVLNGIAGGIAGRTIDIYCGGNHTLTVNHGSGSAVTSDQILLAGGTTYGPVTRGE